MTGRTDEASAVALVMAGCCYGSMMIACNSHPVHMMSNEGNFLRMMACRCLNVARRKRARHGKRRRHEKNESSAHTIPHDFDLHQNIAAEIRQRQSGVDIPPFIILYAKIFITVF